MQKSDKKWYKRERCSQKVMSFSQVFSVLIFFLRLNFLSTSNNKILPKRFFASDTVILPAQMNYNSTILPAWVVDMRVYFRCVRSNFERQGSNLKTRVYFYKKCFSDIQNLTIDQKQPWHLFDILVFWNLLSSHDIQPFEILLKRMANL